MLREEAAWRFRDAAHRRSPTTSTSRPMRRGHPGRGVPRRDGGPRQGRLASARSRFWQRLARRRDAHAPRLAVAPARRSSPQLDGARPPLRARRRLPPARLPEGVHGRHARLADRVDARRVGRGASRAARSSPSLVRRAAAAGWPVAVHAIGDRANREALDAFEATRGEWRAARAAAAHRARADPRRRRTARGSRRSASRASVQFSHAPSDRDLADRFWAGRDAAARTPSGRCGDAGAVVANGSDAPIEELDPLAGHPRPVCSARSTSARRGIPSRR